MNIASKEIHFMGFTMELSEGGEPPEPQEVREHTVFEESKLIPPKIIEEEHQEFSAEFV